VPDPAPPEAVTEIPIARSKYIDAVEIEKVIIRLKIVSPPAGALSNYC
jgi:hypothetical protein